MPLIIGVIAGILLLAWAGVEVDRLVTAYPAESIFAVSAVTIIAVGVAVARFRAANERVPLNPPVRGIVIEAAPARPAIRAAPPRPVTAAAPPAPAPPRVGERCDGPGCQETLDDDPWDCGGVMPDGHEVKGQFCSRACMEAWQRLMTERHRAPLS
jgi:hypothetical protein